MPSENQDTEIAVRSKMNAGLDEKSAREVVQAQANHDAYLSKQAKKKPAKGDESAASAEASK